MKNLNFNVCGQNIIPAFAEKIIADSKNYFNLSFEFSEEWSDFTKTAVITVNDKVYNCLINNDGKIQSKNLPTFEKGALKISVYGGDFLATEEIILNVHPSGYKEGVAPPNIPPEIYTQLTEEINEKTQRVSAAEVTVVTAEASVLEAKAEVTDAAKVVEEDKNYVENMMVSVEETANNGITEMNGLLEETKNILGNNGIKLTLTGGWAASSVLFGVYYFQVGKVGMLAGRLQAPPTADLTPTNNPICTLPSWVTPVGTVDSFMIANVAGQSPDIKVIQLSATSKTLVPYAATFGPNRAYSFFLAFPVK